MKTSLLQSQLAINAARITQARQVAWLDGHLLGPQRQRRALVVKYKRIINHLAILQRALKEEIKAQRTSTRVYKKHPKLPVDTTSYLLESPTNVGHLERSIAQSKGSRAEYDYPV